MTVVAESLRIKHEAPPNLDALRCRFGALVDRKGTIFTYAPYVYLPGGGDLPPELKAHEAVHLRQQGDDPGGWWDRYLIDDAFRLEQELAAHGAEWTFVQKRIRDRNQRTRKLLVIARRLASPLYGSLVTTGEAMQLIRSARAG